MKNQEALGRLSLKVDLLGDQWCVITPSERWIFDSMEELVEVFPQLRKGYRQYASDEAGKQSPFLPPTVKQPVISTGRLAA